MARSGRDKNVSLQGLGGLLAMARRGRSRRPGGDAARFDALQEVLTGPVDQNASAGSQQSTLTAVLTGSLLPEDSQPVRQLLKDNRTSLQALERIKELGKRLASAGPGRADRAAGVAIYYAAIAAAMVHRGRKISSQAPARLRSAFRRLKDQPWMDLTLAVLFKKAEAGNRQAPPPNRKPKANA